MVTKENRRVYNFVLFVPFFVFFVSVLFYGSSNLKISIN